MPHFKGGKALLMILEKYYLVDVGYPQMKGYLGPYKGESYSYEKQVKIVIATMTLHNYIRRNAQRDRDFDKSGNYLSEEVNKEMEVNAHEEDGPGRREMEMLRNVIV
ncbi:hypothetical protein Ddye_024300 [Dipteronia dyeriana]|uniref:DDE Tnp4 domain-containing protein n=1 Tax=Dipteronia dyeriana TaxID=168575 RepID=A0AAD9TV28_9ROSI|nr:hypothetical protein Ddye_024300 [Dipteronia dyeriana]